MNTVEVEEAAKILEALIEDVLRGEEIVLTQDGVPLVKLVPYERPTEGPGR
ncbi:type II toxin-antitoxin system Phd/YefM family antitoxin [Deinococcus pimensis]|uniref:type II toxin-antitoxin system Phd/YefM family antitoxin n=1 Tax=Deinococcus pimensis TaxID=309888 RepID=UPI0004B35C00|nr:hypothetical protein [Deinococcus pimensis]